MVLLCCQTCQKAGPLLMCRPTMEVGRERGRKRERERERDAERGRRKREKEEGKEEKEESAFSLFIF